MKYGENLSVEIVTAAFWDYFRISVLVIYWSRGSMIYIIYQTYPEPFDLVFG